MVIVVAVLAVLTLANIALSVAVIRRLAVHERKLASFTAFRPPSGLAPGAPVPAFVGETHDGRRIDESQLASGTAAVAFFSAHCEACAAHAPEFAQTVKDRPALAVLSGDGGSADTILAALDGIAVVREPEVGPLARGFSVDTYPTYFALEHGHVLSVASTADELGELLRL